MGRVAQDAVPVYLDNDGNGDHGGSYVAPEDQISVNKDVESYTTEEVNWVSTLYIPKGGLAQAVVTDNLPGRYIPSIEAFRYDTYKRGLACY